MQTTLIAFFLAIVLALFSQAAQRRLRQWIRRGPLRVFSIPAALIVLFAFVLWAAGGFSVAFIALVSAYLLFPTALVVMGRSATCPTDFLAILAIWLPLEFAVGAGLLPLGARAVANITARGSSIVLALTLFLLYRDMQGMKYNLPQSWRDALYPALGFVCVAPVLAYLGLKFGFMGPFHGWTALHAGAFGLLWLKTLLGVALPEELLFRALIQNWLMQRFGSNHATVLAAALIFGAAHLDNGPGPLPNWHYMILATIAGFAFGEVFWKSSTILSSAGLHALVNSTRHLFV